MWFVVDDRVVDQSVELSRVTSQVLLQLISLSPIHIQQHYVSELELLEVHMALT